MKCPLCSSEASVPWVEIFAPAARYHRCASCFLVWLDTTFRVSPSVEQARYSSHENDPLSAEYISYLSRTALPVVERLSVGAQGLDYGCGPTEGMKALLFPLGFSIHSYDPFFFYDPSLLKNRYDFVLCSEAAEHFFSPATEFDRIAKLVRAGGWLGVSSRLAVDQEKFPQWWYRRDPTHVCFYSAETVHWIARRWGWRVEFLEDPIWILQKE